MPLTIGAAAGRYAVTYRIGGTVSTRDVLLPAGTAATLHGDIATQIAALHGVAVGLVTVTHVFPLTIVLSEAFTPTNVDGEIAALTFSSTPTQAQCNALRDKCEALADDLRTLVSLLGSVPVPGLNATTTTTTTSTTTSGG